MKNAILRSISCLFALIIVCTASVGCSSPKVLRLGDFEVSMDLLRYFSCNYMKQSGYTKEDVEGSESLQAELEDMVYSTLSELAAYSQLCEQYGIGLTKSEKNQIKEELETLKTSSGSKDEYNKLLEEQFLTEDVYCFLQELNILCSRLYDCLIGLEPYDKDTVKQDISDGNWYSVEYVCVVYTANTTAFDSGKRVELMNALLERARGGEEMSALADEYRKVYGFGEVTYSKLPAFTDYCPDVSESLESTVKSLSVGGYSEVCSLGGENYYIAHRLPLDNEYVDKNFDSDIIEGYQNKLFYKRVKQYQETLSVEYKNKYKNLKLWEL